MTPILPFVAAASLSVLSVSVEAGVLLLQAVRDSAVRTDKAVVRSFFMFSLHSSPEFYACRQALIKKTDQSVDSVFYSMKSAVTAA
jgi:hypothetical protein